MIPRSWLFAGLLAAATLAVSPARAANFIVNDSAMGAFDALPGDGICEHTPGQGDCSVQAAVQESNAYAGADTIALPAGTFPASPFIDIRDSVIVAGAGAASTTIRGNGNNTVLYFHTPVDVALVGVTVTGGRGVNVGGGITMSGGGVLTLIDAVVRGNTTTNVGGGVYVDWGRLVMIGTTVTGNAAGNVGGGVYVGEGATGDLVNSTVSANRAGNTGGGVANEGRTELNNLTVVGNYAGNTGAGVYNMTAYPYNVPQLAISNLIAANNTAPFRGQEDCVGDIVTRGYNLIEQPGCTLTGPGEGTDVFNLDPLLGPLADNGGPTPTHALSPFSPAVNAANPAVPGSGGYACAATDQRGIDRPSGLRCDIGAFELARCGNGVVDPEEDCDDGSNADGDGCDSNCTVTACGNGVVTAGEECDDGNTADDDCCSSSCTLPPTGPLQLALPGGAKFSLKRDGNFRFDWKSGPMAKELFGDPTGSTDVSLCLLDTTGATPALVASATVAAGAGWRSAAAGYSYSSRQTAAGQIAKLKLAGGRAGRIKAKGSTPRLRPGRLPLVTPVTVVLRTSTGTAVFGAGFEGATLNRMEGFAARSE